MYKTYIGAHSNYIAKIQFVLITLFLLDIFIFGGSGIELIDINGFRATLRMVLFLSICIFYFIDVIFLHFGNIIFDKTAIYFYVLLFYCFLSCAYGIIVGNNIIEAVNDLKPVLFLAAYLPIVSLAKSHYINDIYIYKLLLLSSFIVSLVTLDIFLQSYLGFSGFFFNVNEIKNIFLDIGIRENGGVVFPGHLFVLISDVILINKFINNKISTYEFLLILLFSFVIFQSSTRGLILILLLSFIFLNFKRWLKAKKINFKIIFFIFFISILMSLLFLEYDLSRLFVYDDLSTNTRIIFLSEFFDEFLLNPIIGVGYGSYLPSKGYNHLELSYAEILLEQGLVGLLLWVSLILNVIKNCYLEYKKYHQESLKYCIFAVSIVSILSFTNPYINNPLGISINIIVMMILKINRKCI